jgi:type II secretory pathway component PulF
MAVFDYTAFVNDNEAHTEKGRLVARDKLDAFDKLKRNNRRLVSLKKVDGISGFFAKLTAQQMK